jgi:hypothetical protein
MASLWSIVGWLIGLCLTAFFMIQPLIILFFSIPYTLKLRRIGAISLNAPIIKRDFLSVLIQFAIFSISTWALHEFAPHSLFVGYLVGVAWIFIFGGGLIKIIRDHTNRMEYIENNAALLHIEFVNTYLNTIETKHPPSQSRDEHIRIIRKKANI